MHKQIEKTMREGEEKTLAMTKKGEMGWGISMRCEEEREGLIGDIK